MKQSGMEKLRRGAVWVDPPYLPQHQDLLINARLSIFGETASDIVLAALDDRRLEARPLDIANKLAPVVGIEGERLVGRVNGAIKRLVASGDVERVRPGVFRKK